MQLGMIGLGNMGANMARRLLRGGHQCVVFDRDPRFVQMLAADGAVGVHSMEEFAANLPRPRAIWLMISAGAVDAALSNLVSHLSPNDLIVDGGNSHHLDDIRRAKELAPYSIQYVDAGTTGSMWGLERGYRLMIGGSKEAVDRLDPIFRTLAPPQGSIESTTGRKGARSSVERGYLHCGPSGAGHFAKMVHNEIEYDSIAAYADGLKLLRTALLHRIAAAARRTVGYRGTRMTYDE